MRVCSLADQIFNIYKKSNELTNFFKKHPFFANCSNHSFISVQNNDRRQLMDRAGGFGTHRKRVKLLIKHAWITTK